MQRASLELGDAAEFAPAPTPAPQLTHTAGARPVRLTPPKEQPTAEEARLAAAAMRPPPERMEALAMDEAQLSHIIAGVAPRVIRAIGRAQRDLTWLSVTELEAYVHGIPRVLRRRRYVKEAAVFAALEAGELNAHWVAHCIQFDLNMIVRRVAESGQLGRARLLLNKLLALRKVNGHTFAGFFRACANCQRPEVALAAWPTWAQVRLACPACLRALAVFLPRAATAGCDRTCWWRSTHNSGQGLVCLRTLPPLHAQHAVRSAAVATGLAGCRVAWSPRCRPTRCCLAPRRRTP